MPEKDEATPPGVEAALDCLPLEAELVARVAWLIRWRWVAAAAVIVLTLSAKQLLSFTIPWEELCLIGAGILTYNVVFTWRLKILRRNSTAAIQTFSRFAIIQIVLDWLALTLVVHDTGGIESPVLLYFVFNAIVGSILLQAQTAFRLAAFGILIPALPGTTSERHLGVREETVAPATPSQGPALRYSLPYPPDQILRVAGSDRFPWSSIPHIPQAYALTRVPAVSRVTHDSFTTS
ncbi:MAG: hypothetical protein HY713_04990 [candidate division NC10 bacterium]|nr:hypothetical protein [candidate division NC10 bacterium]